MENDYISKAAACARIGDGCAANNDFPAALSWYERVCKIYEKCAGKEHPYVAAALGQIGRVHMRMGQYAQARDAYQRAYDIQRNVFGASHKESLATLVYLADAYKRLRDYHSAISILTRVTFLQEHMSDPAAAVMTCNDLALAHYAAGDGGAALRWLNYAFDKCEPGTPQYALTAYNLGDYYYCANNPKAALSWYMKAYKTYDAVNFISGSADAASGIAKTFGRLSKIPDALVWGERALSLHRSYYGEETEATAASHNNIAIYYHKSGETELAAQHYYSALDTHKKLFGENHILTARSYGNIAGLLESKDEHEESIEYYTRALEIIREQPHDRAEEASICNNIAVAYHRLNNYEKAMSWYLEAARLSLGNDMSSATALGNIGGVCLALKHYDEAERFLIQAYAIFKSTLGEEHPDCATCSFNIGLVYAKRGQYGPALEWYERAYKYIEAAYGDENEQAKYISAKRDEAREALEAQSGAQSEARI